MWLIGNDEGVSFDVYSKKTPVSTNEVIIKFGTIDKYLSEVKDEGKYCWHCVEYMDDKRSFKFHQCLQ